MAISFGGPYACHHSHSLEAAAASLALAGHKVSRPGEYGRGLVERARGAVLFDWATDSSGVLSVGPSALALGCEEPTFLSSREVLCSNPRSAEAGLDLRRRVEVGWRKRRRVLVLDTETTGLDPEEDEVLTLSIVDWHGETVWDGTYRPVRRAEWPDAERVNGISPADVAGCRPIADDADEISRVLASADEVVGYNLSFDLAFLAAAGIWPDPDCLVNDAMLAYAQRVGEWDGAHEGWKWWRLTQAAHDTGFDWRGMRAHGSLADALATRHVMEWCEGRELGELLG